MDKTRVKNYLLKLQDEICAALSALDQGYSFAEDRWQRSEGGGGISRVLTGKVIEKGGVNFSHVSGDTLPKAATLKRPELAGCAFHAMGVSLVMHPANPFAPTSHMNIRFFIAERKDKPPLWWFGGGFDLTPYYGFKIDCVHWHKVAEAACAPFSKDYYQTFKHWCDEYFYLPHRCEPRGVGGLFYDDLNTPDFEHAFGFTQSVGDAYLKAYMPILERRCETPFKNQHRAFQLYRRGRYVEFNLLYDRGTLFGLQSQGRTESILMSLPPLVAWHYNYQPDQASVEARLTKDFLKPQDWLAKGDALES